MFLLTRKGYQITGVDASPVGIEIANMLKSNEPTAIKDKLNFKLLDITEPKIGDDWYDSAWSTQVFEHIPNPEPIIKGLRQYVKTGSYFLICVPYKHAYDDPGHCNHFYTEADLENFLNPYITVEKVVLDNETQVLRALCKF